MLKAVSLSVDINPTVEGNDAASLARTLELMSDLGRQLALQGHDVSVSVAQIASD